MRYRMPGPRLIGQHVAACSRSSRPGHPSLLHAVHPHTVPPRTMYLWETKVSILVATVRRHAVVDLPCYLGSMGHLKMQLGDYTEAEGLFQEALSVSRRIGFRWEVANALQGLAKCFQQKSSHKEAATFLEEAYRLWNELSQPGCAQQNAWTLVELKRSQGEWGAALYWYDQTIATCRVRKRPLDVISHLIGKGELLVELQRHGEAALYFEAAIAGCRKKGYSWLDEGNRLCAT